MPNSPPDVRILRELAQEYELQMNPISQASKYFPDRIVLVRMPFSDVKNSSVCLVITCY
jgi:hypothetical protein